jgi:hypothetical protein
MGLDQARGLRIIRYPPSSSMGIKPLRITAHRRQSTARIFGLQTLFSLVTANKAGYQIGFLFFLKSWVGLCFGTIYAETSSRCVFLRRL